MLDVMVDIPMFYGDFMIFMVIFMVRLIVFDPPVTCDRSAIEAMGRSFESFFWPIEMGDFS